MYVCIVCVVTVQVHVCLIVYVSYITDVCVCATCMVVFVCISTTSRVVVLNLTEYFIIFCLAKSAFFCVLSVHSACRVNSV